MGLDQLLRTIDRGDNNENDFAILLECMITEISTNRALIDVILNQFSQNEADYQSKQKHVAKEMDLHREKVIEQIYSRYGHLPPELLED